MPISLPLYYLCREANNNEARLLVSTVNLDVEARQRPSRVQGVVRNTSGVASYGALGHVTSNSFIFVHFGVNMTANYPRFV